MRTSRQIRRIRLLLGTAVWTGALVWFVVSAGGRSGGSAAAVGLCADLVSWAVSVPDEFTAESQVPLLLAPGDPIFTHRNDGSMIQAGRVLGTDSGLLSPVWTKRCLIRLDPKISQELAGQDLQLTWRQTPSSLQWVGETLLSEEIRSRLAVVIAEEWEQNRSAAGKELEPLIQEVAGLFLQSVQAELPRVMESHREQFLQLAEQYRGEVIQQQLVPLVREEILPIVEAEVRPAAMELGRELWERVSLWSFTWRYLYDLSPLPRRDAVRQEFDRFLAREIRPALEARTENIVEVMERILTRVSQNPRVQQEIRQAIRSAVEDSTMQQVVWSVLQQSLIENQTLRTSLKQYFASDRVQSKLALTGRRLEPMVRRIGDEVFGNRDSGITAEFARVMRVQILLKDRRWLVLEPATQPAPGTANQILTMKPAAVPAEFPLRFSAESKSPLTPELKANSSDTTKP